MASSLQFKKEEEPPEIRCPSCGASLPEGSVLCVQCGYDFRSGRRVDEEVAPRSNPLMIAGVALLVAVAAVLVAWRILSDGESVPPPVAAPAPVVAPAPPAEPAPVPAAPATTTVAAVEAPVVSNPVAVVEAVVETNTVPVEPPVDPAVLAGEQRVIVTEQLDQQAPMYQAGDELELRLTNGLVQRGVFVSRTEQNLLIQVGSNQTKVMEFSLLDRGSRVRGDAAYRSRYIEFHVNQRVQKLMQQDAVPGEARTP